ncbi:phage major capsid protein [Marinobacter sp. JSM 1782161]|uniref:phage major capsid protein n=1 Tax=Marinobacter sp. JSM 1782161 TaxID=2685906 RepID=UPI001401D612|nr:phage major capsid protein [Marinobacter sp. JSM 1782161]
MDPAKQLEKLAEQTDRVYSALTIKALDDEKREFTGIATTPSTDRMDDIVEPDGAQFDLPIPLLWQHDRMAPIGKILTAKMTDKGIEVTGTIAKVDSPPGLSARLDEAWQSLKHELVRGLSIGFRPIEYMFMDNGGIHFTKWDWLELSAVTIPANAEATISSIKSYDAKQWAAPGRTKRSVVRLENPAGASAKVGCTKCGLKHVDGDGYDTFTRKLHDCKNSKPKPQEGRDMNIEEQIKGFEATRQAKAARMAEIMEAAGDEGRTLDSAETEEYDTLQDEVKATDDHLKRLRDLQETNKQKAEPVDDRTGMQKRSPATPKVTEKLSPGIEFARYVMCLGAAKGDLATAKSIAEKRFPQNERINTTLKAAVEAGTTTDAQWALPLVEYNQFAGDFVEYLRPQTILGKFGAEGVPALRSIPFNVHIRGQTSGGSGYWVGQGAPKPLTKFDFNDAYLGYAKVANIAVLTEELMRFSNPSAEALVRDSLAGALIERMDTDFIDPDKVEVSNVSPASVTNGVTPVVSSGNDADAIRVDVGGAMQKFIAANITPASGVWIMSATTALNLSLMRNALGQKEFPEITMMGGSFEGLPVIVSEYVPTSSSGHYVILMNASDVWLADDGNVVIDASREASLQMLDNPTNNSSSGTATSMVSMFQTNSVAIRAERWINWKKRRESAVALISGVNWGEPAS